ncbi:hypothetical protein V6S67_19435 [Arthrobacter sp. Soc17.1.1.1]|uniref:hypothetical protein n=1 Tax=Arthrobacter sp. Soc17.1.1.1 TaxID=3121277 RepID=UPI002FE4E63F
MNHLKYILTTFDEVADYAPDREPTVADDESAYLAMVDGQSGAAAEGSAVYRDLLRAVVGMTYSVDADPKGGPDLFKVLPADAIRVISVFRLLGAVDQITVTLPERYWEIIEEHASSIENQMHAAETIRWAEISGGVLRRPAN